MRRATLRGAWPALLPVCLVVLGQMIWPAHDGASWTDSPASGGPLPVMVLAGQSNMIGWVTDVNDLTADERATQTSVLFYGPNALGSTWGWLTPPTETYDRFGPEISLGQNLVSSGAYDLVAQVKYAVSGTNLASDWNPERGSPFLYANMLARAQTALSALQAAYPDRRVFVAGFFWMQGESDGQDASMAAAYGLNLTHLIAHVRSDFQSPLLPVFVGRIRLTTPYASLVRQGEAAVAGSVGDVSLVDTDALPMAPDGLHYTSAGVVTLGTDFAASYSDWLRNQHSIFLPLIFSGRQVALAPPHWPVAAWPKSEARRAAVRRVPSVLLAARSRGEASAGWPLVD